MSSIKTLLLRYNNTVSWKGSKLYQKNYYNQTLFTQKLQDVLTRFLWTYKLFVVSASILATTSQINIYFNYVSFQNKKLTRSKKKIRWLLALPGLSRKSVAKHALTSRINKLALEGIRNKSLYKSVTKYQFLFSNMALSGKLVIGALRPVSLTHKTSVVKRPLLYSVPYNRNIGPLGHITSVKVGNGSAHAKNRLGRPMSWLPAKAFTAAKSTGLPKDRVKRRPLDHKRTAITSARHTNHSPSFPTRGNKSIFTTAIYQNTITTRKRAHTSYPVARKLREKYQILALKSTFSQIVSAPVNMIGKCALTQTTRHMLTNYNAQVLASLPFQYVHRLFFIGDLVTTIIVTTLLRTSSLLSFYLARLLERLPRHTWLFHIFNRVMSVFRFYCRAPISLKILIKGRVNKKLRKNTVCVLRTQVALSTLDSSVDYSLTHSYTSASVLGVKVWVVSNSRSALTKTFSQRYKTY